jgi:hypothetical protein
VRELKGRVKSSLLARLREEQAYVYARTPGKTEEFSFS